MGKKEGNGKQTKEEWNDKGQKRLVETSHLSLSYAFFSLGKSSLSKFLKFQNNKNSRAEYSVFGELLVKILGNIPHIK